MIIDRCPPQRQKDGVDGCLLARLSFLSIALALILSACSGDAEDWPGLATSAVEEFNASQREEQISTPVSPARPSPTLASPVLTTPTASPPAHAPTDPPEPDPPPRTRYTLTAVLDYDRHHLAVEAEISYLNHTGEALDDLLLIVEPSRYRGAFQLKELAWADGQPVADFNREIGRLVLPLSQPLQPGERLGLALVYELNLPLSDPDYYGRPVPFGYTPRQTNLVDWYPFVPPYLEGQGWLAHEAGFFGEHLAYEVADFEVSLRLAGDRDDLVIAASAPAEIDGEWRRYQHGPARNFAWSASHQYQVKSAQVGDVTVLSYHFPFSPAAGERVLQATAEALALFSELFGPYPHRTLSAVEADFLDGMEYDGLYFLSKGFYNSYSGSPADYLTAIAVHETAHQWWYGLVGNDQALEPWLDEALCTYSERLYYERVYPEGLHWWWTYRVNYFQPRGWVDGSIYNPEGYLAYRDAVYLNGAVFLEELRARMGEEDFFAFLRDYAGRNTHRLATAADFFTVLGEHTAEDLSGLMEMYFKNR